MMNGNQHHDRDRPMVHAVLALLAEVFPAAFFAYERRRRPLKLKIHLDILAVLNGAITPEELSAALAVYTWNRSYRSGLVAGATRIDLSGQSAGVVTPEQAAPARHQRVRSVRLHRLHLPSRSRPAQKQRRLSVSR